MQQQLIRHVFFLPLLGRYSAAARIYIGDLPPETREPEIKVRFERLEGAAGHRRDPFCVVVANQPVLSFVAKADRLWPVRGD